MKKILIVLLLIAVLFIGGCTEGSTGQATVKETESGQKVTTTVCTPEWECSEWGKCTAGYMKRTCNDKNNCGGVVIPETTRICTCTPNWKCSDWGDCSSFGKQTRTCIDYNKCGISIGKPSEVQSCKPPIIEPEPIILSGNGKEATSFFELEKGLSIFEMKHDGDHNFIIWLYKDDGDRIDLLVNEIGEFDGSTVIGIDESGSYLLDITADGNWQISIE